MRNKGEKVTCRSLKKHLLDIVTDSRKACSICFSELETVPSVVPVSTVSFGSLSFSKIPGSVNNICI